MIINSRTAIRKREWSDRGLFQGTIPILPRMDIIKNYNYIEDNLALDHESNQASPEYNRDQRLMSSERSLMWRKCISLSELHLFFRT